MVEPNGTVKPSASYVRLSEAAQAFDVITDQLEELATKKAYEGDKDLLAQILADVKLSRHRLMGLVGAKLSTYETKQAAKLTPAAS